MAEYMTAFEMEIAAEGFIDSISEKTSKILATLRRLFDACIKFLTGLISKLHKNKGATNQDPTPNSQAGGGAEVMKQGKVVPVYKEATYDCGKELYDILADLNFCMEMIVKRPKPDYKTNKSYKERWFQDNQLIVDRMERCANTLDKLESIENKTVNLEAAEDLKKKFEDLNEVYEKYGRMFKTYATKRPETNAFMIDTQVAITVIAEVAGRAARINLSLMVPKDD